MATLSVDAATVSTQYSRVDESYLEPFWYAAQTTANHEKSVAEQLLRKSVEHFLPLYKSLRCRKDRKVQLQVPLFPGYVFVRLALSHRLTVLQIPGVARLVGFGGTPAALPDEEIAALRLSLGSGVGAEPHPFLALGRQVRVTKGPMTGLQGILKRRKSGTRLVVSVELIRRAIALEVDEADIKPLQ